ncbi:hypothetical protein TpMuguga_02g00306 [Theileria parva strain Muguga]|uniref:Uncharacterized protein n=1 Tax=Theileria parva TaxID=5875 RepID=Q4N5I4_THEPA|nr:uncharacterized protein TpMuguga_02g00306 [Theileria parva strain Muguga]EAN32589.1 hypothetical protein TpMuguga_02g00306 [Theileria parva strain Muguga]|eukprot:XP_764872.1 hypothetical protein [Theileria parva strain Muguga]
MTGICLPEPYQPNTQLAGNVNSRRNFVDNSKQLAFEGLKNTSPKYATEYNISHEPISTIRLSNSVSDSHRLGKNAYYSTFQRRVEGKPSPNHLKYNPSYSTKYEQQPVSGVKIPVNGIKRIGIPNKLTGVNNRNSRTNYDSLISANFNESFTTNCEYLERMSSIDTKDFAPFETNDPDFLRNFMYYEKMKKGLLDNLDKDQTQVKNKRDTQMKQKDDANRKQTDNENTIEVVKPNNKVYQTTKTTVSRETKNKSEEHGTNSTYYDLSKSELCDGIASIGLALSKVFRFTGAGVLFVCSSFTDNVEGLIKSRKQNDSKNKDTSHINDIKAAMASMYDEANPYDRNCDPHCNKSSAHTRYKCPYPCSTHDRMTKDCRHMANFRDTFNPNYGLMGDHYNPVYNNLRENQDKIYSYQDVYGLNKGLDTRHNACTTDYSYDRLYRHTTTDYNTPIHLNNFRIDYDSDLDDLENKNTIPGFTSKVFTNVNNRPIGVRNLDHTYENKPDMRTYDLKTSIPVSSQRNPVSNFKFTNSPKINISTPNDHIGSGANRTPSDIINTFDVHKAVDLVQSKKSKGPQEHFGVPSVVGYGANNPMPQQPSPENNQNNLSLINTQKSPNSQTGNIIIKATQRSAEGNNTSSSVNNSNINTTSDSNYTSSANTTGNTTTSNTSNTDISNTGSNRTGDSDNSGRVTVHRKYNNEEERLNEIKRMEVKHGLNVLLQEQQKMVEAAKFSDTEVEPNEIELKKKAKKKMFKFSRK